MEIGDQRIHHLVLISRINKDLGIIATAQQYPSRFRCTFEGTHRMLCRPQPLYYPALYTPARHQPHSAVLPHIRGHDVIFDIIHAHRLERSRPDMQGNSAISTPFPRSAASSAIKVQPGGRCGHRARRSLYTVWYNSRSGLFIRAVNIWR